MLYDYRDVKILKKGQEGFGFLIEEDSGFISPTHELNANTPFLVTEIDGGSKHGAIITEPYYVYAVLTKCDVLNRNNRIYGEDIQKREAEKFQTIVDDFRAVGEHNHPDSSVIAGDRVSHNVIKMWWEKKSLLGQIELILSPAYVKYGIICCQADYVANLLRHKIKIGISSRAVGTVKKNEKGIDIVQDDLEWICFDIVINPSNTGSWIVGKPEMMRQFVETENKKGSLLIDSCKNFLLS